MQSHYFGCRINPAMPDVWTRFEIDAPIANAEGGEAGIFNVKGAGPVRRVAKVYNTAAKATLDPDAFEALAFLTSKYTEFSQAMPFVAWPLEVLFTEERPLPINHLDALAGITMKRIDGVTTLEKLTTNGTGRVGLGNEAAVRIAATISGQLRKLHQHGIVFCDFNPRNVLVTTNKASVSFVDADAFQHGFGHRIFTKPHFTPGYASIDHLQNKPGARTPADDNFVLAIHVFQLLTDGGHPFKTGPKFEPPGGAPLFGEVSPDDNILAHRWPYSNIAVYHPPGQTPRHYARLHPELKAMFTRAFEHFQPPTAEEWENLLPRFRDSADDPATRVQAPNPNAVSPPPRPASPPAPKRVAYSVPPPTVIVPALAPPKRRSAFITTLSVIGAILQFILLVLGTLLRGGPMAVLRLLTGMLGSFAFELGRRYPRQVFGAFAMLIAGAMLGHYVGTPAQPGPIATYAPAYHAPQPSPPKPKSIAKPAPDPASVKEAAGEREVLPWKVNTDTREAASAFNPLTQVRPPAADGPSNLTRVKRPAPPAAEPAIDAEDVKARAMESERQRAAGRTAYRTPRSWGRARGDAPVEVGWRWLFLRVGVPIADIVQAILERGVDLGLLLFAAGEKPKPPSVVGATRARRLDNLPAVSADAREQLPAGFRLPECVLPVLEKMSEDVAAHRYFEGRGSKLQKMVRL